MLWVPAVHTGNLEKQCVNSFKNSGTKPTSVTGSDADGRGAVPRTGVRAARCEGAASCTPPALPPEPPACAPGVDRQARAQAWQESSPARRQPLDAPGAARGPCVCGRGSVRTRPCAPPSCCPDRREAMTESPVRVRELAAPSPSRSGVCPCAALPVARWATAGPAPAASLAVLETATRPRTAVGTHQTAAPVSRDLPHAGGSALGELTHVALSF